MNGAYPTPGAFTLGELSLPVRLTLALFLISVGIGYVSALVQLHFQHASPGDLLPSAEDAVRVFHGDVGEKPKSKIEQLLPQDYQGKKMNGQGQMTAAFFKRSEDYSDAIAERARELAKKRGLNKKAAKEEEYRADNFPLPEELIKHPLTPNMLVENAEPKAVKIQTLFQQRCVTCHQ